MFAVFNTANLVVRCGSSEFVWQTIQTEMIDAMIRLEKSLSSFVAQLS
jgi:hypothetical protein